MNKFSRLSFVFLLLVTALPASGQNSSSEFRELRSQLRAQATALHWYVFRSPDDDFTVEFPAEPKRDEDLPGDVAVLRGYSYLGNSLWLSVNFQDLGFQTDSSRANDLGPNIDEIMARYTEG